MSCRSPRPLRRLGAILLGALCFLAMAPATPAAARTSAIPDGALLQPADLGGVTTSPAAGDLRPWLRPPQPCGHHRYPVAPTADRTVQALYPVAEVRPTVLLEYVAVLPGGGAARYLRYLSRAVTRCGGCTDQGRSWRILGRGIAGRDSMLLSVSETVEYGDTSSRVQTTYVAVARTGHAIVVLADIGWEAGDGHEAIVRALAPVAVERAAVIG